MSEIPKNTIFYVFGKVIIAVLGVLVTTVLARILGPEKYGILSLGNSIAVIFIVLSQLGLHISIIYFIARNVKDRSKVKGIINFSLRTSILSAGVFSLVLALSSGLISSYYRLPLLALVIPFFAIIAFFSNISMLLQSIFNGFKKMYYYFLMDVFYSFGKLFAPLFVLLGFNLMGAVFGYSLSAVIMAFSGFYFLFKEFYPKDIKPVLKGTSEILKYTVPVYALTILERANVQMQNILLGFLSSVQVSYYNISSTISAFLVIFGQAIAQSLMPEISEAKEKKDVLRKIYFSNKYLAIYALFAGPLLILMRKYVISIIFGNNYLNAADTFSIVILGGTIYLLGFVGAAILLGQNKPKRVFLTVAMQFLTNLVLCYLFIQKFQSVGAATAYLFSTLLSTLLFFINSKKIIDFKYPVKDFVKTAISSLLMSVSVYYVSSNLHFGLTEIFIDLGLAVLVYSSSLVLMKAIGKEDIQIIKNVIKIK